MSLLWMRRLTALLALVGTVAGGIWNYVAGLHQVETERTSVSEKQSEALKDEIAKLKKELQKNYESLQWPPPPSLLVGFQDRMNERPVVSSNEQQAVDLAKRVQRVAGGWFGRLDLSKFKLESFSTKSNDSKLRSYVIELSGSEEFDIGEPITTITLLSTYDGSDSAQRRVTVTPVLRANIDTGQVVTRKTLTRILVFEQVFEGIEPKLY